MKVVWLATALLLPTLALAEPPTRLEEMQQKCEKEKASMFRDNEGTKTCDRLAKLYSDYEARTLAITQDLRAKCDKEQASMFRANNGTPSCEKLNQVLRDRASQPIGDNYHFSKDRGRYCYFRDDGTELSCP
ncbi:hypothetical protein [Pseudomonas sp. TE3610]